MAAQKRNKPFKGLGLEHMNEACPVIPSQLTSSTLQSCKFQVISFSLPLLIYYINHVNSYRNFFLTCLQQMDAFCLRERDLLNRFVLEASQYLKQRQSKEYAFNLVTVHLFFLHSLYSYLFLFLSLIVILSCIRVISQQKIQVKLSQNENFCKPSQMLRQLYLLVH